ncbi:MAG: DNA repair ATPase [Rhodanobacteraceae bacterium]|nr:DNA repair ATPase [Rhodanobacteraceae bacterium]
MTSSATFDLLRKRLAAASESLRAKADALNAKRISTFGRIEPKLTARLSARTEHNCVARDIVRVGERLLFGYNVTMGLKKETRVEDVFCLYQLAEGAEGVELQTVPIAGSFLDDQRFVADFRELFTYYKATTLDQLRLVNERLLLIFRTGSQPGDKRVFRFAVDTAGALTYIDNRGERDHVLPPSHSFEWQPVGREDHVLGRHAHVNILDTVFVETIGGDLTIKIENNTDTGLGIYSEPVEDKNQALADAEIAYADLPTLILLSIKPYRENHTRYLVYNKRLKQVLRIDEIGDSCVELPEDHGIVFPGGYYLESGDFKHFKDLGHDFSGYRLKRTVRAPSGEDVLYVFYDTARGDYALLPYNLIDRAIGQPLLAAGYARFDDGQILLVTPEGSDASRLHTMQLWRTPFASEEHASAQPKVGGLLGRLGNANVVRALAELRELTRLAEDAASEGAYERLLKLAARCVDAHPWLAEAEVGQIAAEVGTLARSGREALEAYEKLERARQSARQAVEAAQGEVSELLSKVVSLLWQKPEDFTEAIRAIKRKRGELTGLREQAHVDLAAIDAQDTRLREELDRIGERALKFFADPAAFASLRKGLNEAAAAVDSAKSTKALAPIGEKLDALAESLDGLSELIASFEQTDAQQRAILLGQTSALYAEVNRIRAGLRTRREGLLEQEQGLEFGAQLTVLEQSLTNLLARSDSPEAIDEALARTLGQIEHLEGRFGSQPGFLVELTSRREAALEAFAARREQIAAQRDKRAQGLRDAVSRVLDGIPRRIAKLSEADELHGFFAGDTLVERAQAQIEELRQLGAAVQADELAGRLRSLKEAGLRDLRDRLELGTSGDSLALGRQRFTIERRPLDLALLHNEQGLSLQLTGTDYRVALDEPEAEQHREVWGQVLPNETESVYRAEYLAWRIWQRASAGDAAINAALRATEGSALADLVAEEAQRHPTEDYQRGVHDADATRIVQALDSIARQAGELRWPASARVLAQAWFAGLDAPGQASTRGLAAGLGWFLARGEGMPVPPSWQGALSALAAELGLPGDASSIESAARHLAASLGGTLPSFAASGRALDLAEQVSRELPVTALAALNAPVETGEKLALAGAWCARVQPDAHPASVLEAAAILCFPGLARERINVELHTRIEGLRGEHARVKQGVLELDFPEFLIRLAQHQQTVAPAWSAFAALRHRVSERERKRLGLHRFEAKPLAGFVRNRLIDEVYLPLIGNNLAKQIGTIGDQRSDRSGLLLLISPPGYGKTTLMEYIADRLGMIFVRVNGPTLGHEITSLDPAQASTRGAAEELVKLNLGLAMGVNVMLYVDDIQHCSPEFLQKFISLADGTRRIDAVIDGSARTIDLRGKRFALVMAGNPYTETGEMFRIPDMLANRADVYNLGDVLSGREALFADSYIENALTANPLSAPLAERPRAEIQTVLRIARGDDELLPSGLPGGVELVELVKRMLSVRDVLGRVNASYVASAAQDDSYRTEPPFKLQGSYRNMVKLAAQLSPLMTEAELDALIRDHYRGEAQTLGARAEENLLKLAQLIGHPSAEEATRWQQLVDNFQRLMKQGGKEADGATRAAQVLADIAQQLQKQNEQSAGTREALKALESLGEIRELLARVPRDPQLDMPPALADTLTKMAKAYENTLVPIVSALHHKMTLDHDIWEQVRDMRKEVDALMKRIGSGKRAP